MIYFIVISLLLYSISNCNKKVYLRGVNVTMTSYIKALLSIVVILHHLSFRYKENIFLNQFSMMGTICVALFFFLSGYGLMVSFVKNKKIYLRDFLKNRFSKLLPAFFIATVLYTSYSIAFYGWQYVLARFVNGFPPLPTSWFVYAISWLYLSFYIACKLFKNLLAFNAVLLIINIFYCIIVLFIFGWGGWWVNAIFAFNLGVALVSIEHHINFNKQINISVLIILSTITIFSVYCQWTVIYNLTICILVWFVFRGINPPEIPFFRVLGKYSYEIYLVQGAVIALLFNISHLDSFPVFGILLVLIVTFVCAYFLSTISSNIYIKNKIN